MVYYLGIAAVFAVYVHRSPSVARPPSFARRRSPAAGLAGCAQQYQHLRTAVTYQVGNAVT